MVLSLLVLSWRCPMLTAAVVAVLVVFLGLLAVADLLPRPSDAPGLVAPLG
jgi:hypothetical protein